MWETNLALARAALSRGLALARDLEMLAPLWLGPEPRDVVSLLLDHGLITAAAADSLRRDVSASAATLITPTPPSALDATRVASSRPGAGTPPAPPHSPLAGGWAGWG